jgi:uncharacterized protein YcbX
MRLAAIHIYPVKSCRGHALAEATVEKWGLAGDRRWMIVDAEGRFVTQREEPRLATISVEVAPDGLALRRGEDRLFVPTPSREAPRPAVSVWRSTVPARIAAQSLEPLIGRDLRLAYMDDPLSRPVNPEYGAPEDRVSFADGYPLLLASTTSLDDLNARMAGPLPMDRFRPNLVVDGEPPWAEDYWRRIRIGAAVFRIVKPCDRCIVTTTDQATGARGAAGGEPLRTLARFRRRGDSVFFAQNLIPDATGTIRIGDPVEVLDQAVSANWVA